VSRRPALDRASGTKALVVAFALGLALLLALVALASSGELGSSGGRGDGGGALPSGAFSYVYALFLALGILALPFFVFLYARETPYSAARRRRARFAPFVLLAILTFILFVASRWPEGFTTALERLRIFDPDDQTAGRAGPPSPERTPIAIVWGGVFGVLALVVAWQLLRPRRGILRRVPSLAESLSDALAETLDDLRAEPDPRRAIILAYARMESTLTRCGVAREESEAPLEYLARVLLSLEVRPRPVERLTDLFEQAKFSDHPMDAAMKEDALEALEEVRDDLRGMS
jgi:hypothetical protein